ncbi:50S ribosomal protein L4 [Iris pallida]|uniref:Large ribosomal subunit protein uL4c n=1 Tax=Iris pallida TaxID=29817 RepID=A0AAX6I6N2_IRIPA|nr:50S ribosomal protein L4 [Iris pallida]
MSMMTFSTTASSLSFFSSSLFLPPNSISAHLKSPTPPPILHLHCSSSRSIKSQLSPSGGGSGSGNGNGSATLPVLSFTGEKVDSATLSLKSAPSSTARAVVHRGIIADQQNSRRGTASTLTRAEVRGGGKKPYPQKKTGRARRGSQRTPLRPGGGVTFGPKPRDWSIKINRKEKRLAVSTAIASAAASEDALVVEDFEGEFAEGPKTSDFVAAMRRWGLDPKEKAMFLMTEVTDNVRLSCRNIGTLKLLTPRTLNLFDVLDSGKLVFTRSAVDYLNSMYGEEEEEEEEELLPGALAWNILHTKIGWIGSAASKICWTYRSSPYTR